MGSIGLFLLLGGFACYLSGITSGPVAMIIGFAVVVFMMFGWFGTVIDESEKGRYNDQVDVSFRMGMGWFIFSEVLFFAAFFGALFYARVYSVPWMGGEGVGALATHPVLWPDYEAAWPTNGPGNIGDAFDIIPAFGIPALNTIILLTSGVTVTFAHWALKKNQRARLSFWLFVTVALGVIFLYYQGVEVLPRLRRPQPDARIGDLRLDLLHADRIPRLPRHGGRDDAGRDLGAHPPGPLHPEEALRLRRRRLVLALRRRGVARPLHLRLLAVASPGAAACAARAWAERRFFPPYRTMEVQDTLPAELVRRTVYIVREDGFDEQAALLCPCGCGRVLQMNLLPDERPCWRVMRNADGTVTLDPSVWRKKDCGSHFWLHNGRIRWCRERHSSARRWWLGGSPARRGREVRATRSRRM